MKRALKRAMVGCLVLGLEGCAASFPTIKPIAPPAGHPLFPTTVSSLRPTFQWEPLNDSTATYDFILYEGIGNIQTPPRAVGRQVYYREGLTQPRCELEQALKPNTEYYWSVRVRRGQTVSPWALYNYDYFTGLGIAMLDNRLFIFKTPKVEQ